MARRVLIVDDSATARMLIRRCVEIAGWADAEMKEAANGKEALNTLASWKADLVLSDLNMPEMDGEELLKAVRSDDSLRRVPLIVITSAGNEPKEAQLRRDGATAILGKPISPAVIADIIEKIFGDSDEY